MNVTTIEEVLALMGRYPLLNANGHGVPRGVDLPEDARAKLLTPGFLREVDACRAWLRGAVKTKQISSRAGNSYSLKHRVERSVGFYICNGAFITAALLEGFMMERAFNPHFNLAKRRSNRRVDMETLTIAINALRARGFGMCYFGGKLCCIDSTGAAADKGIIDFLSEYAQDEVLQALSTPYMDASGEVVVTRAWKGAPVMPEIDTRH